MGVYEVGGVSNTYVVSLPRVLQKAKFPAPGCPEVAHSAGRLREHLIYRHFWSKMAVFQEGVELLPRCESCVMHMPAGRLIKHQRTARCDKNSHMRWWRRDVAIADKFTEETFSLTGEDKAYCIEVLEVFKYLGRLLDRSDDNCPAVL